MATVSDSYAHIGDHADLIIVYDDTNAVDDPTGPPGNKWEVLACDVIRIEIVTSGLVEVEAEMEVQGNTWRGDTWPVRQNPQQQTTNWQAAGQGSPNTIADISHFYLSVDY